MKARKIALWGIMGALTLAISFLEGFWELPFLPPGARPGFSNIITVLAALTVGVGGIFYLTALKVVFALLTRGVTACLLSLAGGVCSGVVTALLVKSKKQPFSLFGVAVSGALAHNAGQLGMACLLTQTTALWLYGPVLLLFSLISGGLTGTVIRLTAPYCIKGVSKTMKEHPLTSVAKNRGGVHVAHHKNTRFMPAARIPAPEEVILPMQQSIGAPCTPLVQKGDLVKVGQKIGDTDAFMSVPVHASVSGTVTAVGPVRLAGGSVCTGVTIASDGKMESLETLQAPHVTNKEELLAAVRESGVVGLGGAGFPTHVKLRVPPEKHIDTLIINAAECEPYITVDNREAVDNSWDVLSGVYTIKELMEIPRVVIAVEDNKPQAIKVLESIAERDKHVDVMRLKSLYPQGAEKMLVFSVTGRRVPDGGLPADVGCIVMNIATVAFISRYLKTGKPLVSRSITVDGTAIRNPRNLRVPIGTKLSDIVAACGGFTREPEKIIFGGPMMGVAIYNLNAPLCKQNNALLAFEKADRKQECACIHCGRCVQACPMSLAPALLKRDVEAHDTEEMKKHGLMSCMECGCCAFSCPSGIPLVQYMKLGKQALREAKK